MALFRSRGALRTSVEERKLVSTSPGRRDPGPPRSRAATPAVQRSRLEDTEREAVPGPGLTCAQQLYTWDEALQSLVRGRQGKPYRTTAACVLLDTSAQTRPGPWFLESAARSGSARAPCCAATLRPGGPWGV